MLAFIVENTQLHNSVNTIITNANIGITWQGLKSLFMDFLMVVLNIKDWKSSVNYKEKAINSIA